MGMLIDAMRAWAKGERGYEKPSEGSFSRLPGGINELTPEQIVDGLIANGLKLRHDYVVTLNAAPGSASGSYVITTGNWVYLWRGTRLMWSHSFFWRDDCGEIVKELRSRIASIRRY
jgi:hypothetical protein